MDNKNIAQAAVSLGQKDGVERKMEGQDKNPARRVIVVQLLNFQSFMLKRPMP
jgi:hypothetical protein